jgi:hypothetical protein
MCDAGRRGAKRRGGKSVTSPLFRLHSNTTAHYVIVSEPFPVTLPTVAEIVVVPTPRKIETGPLMVETPVLLLLQVAEFVTSDVVPSFQCAVAVQPGSPTHPQPNHDDLLLTK